ncbi:hypothetical protein M5K25_014050 [Dendrobium thyrsiflorum]|uniref:Uncharacterized protein n=1 Tax=Dendrobium thyrsiflorum TaxID=117978 RepID=A0ABD0UV13_DENTH
MDNFVLGRDVGEWKLFCRGVAVSKQIVLVQRKRSRGRRNKGLISIRVVVVGGKRWKINKRIGGHVIAAKSMPRAMSDAKVLKDSMVQRINANPVAGWKAFMNPRFSNYTNWRSNCAREKTCNYEQGAMLRSSASETQKVVLLRVTASDAGGRKRDVRRVLLRATASDARSRVAASDRE